MQLIISIAITHGVHAAAWADSRPGVHVVRAIVSALDTLRAMATRLECADVLFDELAGADARLDDYVAALRYSLQSPESIEYRPHLIVENISISLQGSLLV